MGALWEKPGFRGEGLGVSGEGMREGSTNYEVQSTKDEISAVQK